MTETVAVIHRVLSSGSSFPSLAETEQGRRFVLKLSGAGPGKRALATEYVALGLARYAGLNVPKAEVLEIPRDLSWQAGTDEFYEAVQRSAGLNLGVVLIPAAEDVKASDLAGLPADFAGCLATVDALLQNVDRTAANPNIMRDAAGAHWAIDFGACLLIERLARSAMEPRRDLPPNHFLAGGAVALAERLRDLVRTIDPATIEAITDGVPTGWLDDLGVAPSALRQRLTTYPDGLRAP